MTVIPDAEPLLLLEAFLLAHAKAEAVPAMLYTRGEEVFRRLSAQPPAHPTWGRFLVAMGQLAADAMDDRAAASRFFLQALQTLAHHGDTEAAITAGYNQGVLQERVRHLRHAEAAYRAAASEGLRCGVVVANTLRAGVAAIRLYFAEHDQLGDVAPLAKQLWLGWLWLRRHQPEQLDAELVAELQRQLAALLLPEEQPALLLTHWRAWAPAALTLADGTTWDDGMLACRQELCLAAAEAAEVYLANEQADAGAPYRWLHAALARHG